MSYEGCFRDIAFSNETKLKNKTAMTLEMCADHCFKGLTEQYRYMGLQVGSIFLVNSIL